MLTTLILIGGLGTTELFFILLIALLLFGGRKIPELARDLGTGIRDFRRSLSAPPEDDNKSNGEQANNNGMNNPKELEKEELKQIEYQPTQTSNRKSKSSNATQKVTRKTTRKA